MAVDSDYQEYVIDILTQAGLPATARAMFGGAGIYYRNRIIGVIVNNELYLRLEKPPTKGGRSKHFGKKYTLVPADDLEDQDLLRMWTEKLKGKGTESTGGT